MPKLGEDPDFPLGEILANMHKRPQYEKGRENEAIVEKVLRGLQEGKRIKSFAKTSWFDTDDRNGVDFFVVLNTGVKVCLQVKSSFAGKQKHVQNHGYGTVCVVVHDETNYKRTKVAVRRALGL